MMKPTSTLLQVKKYHVDASPHLTEWLAEQQVSLAFTLGGTQLVFTGLNHEGSLRIHEAHFERCLGLTAANTNTLYLVSRYQIWRLENALPAGELLDDGTDRLYLPQSAHTTGNLGIHDIAIDSGGRILFVNTAFNCIATPGELDNFVPLWQPSFMPNRTQVRAADCCHMTGLAMKEGKAAYVTCTATSAEPRGWLQHRRAGGVVVDVASDEIVGRGLSLPQSPRWYRDRLWVLNGGTGHFGYIDTENAAFEPVAFCPGILRGLTFVGDYAIIGCARPEDAEMNADIALFATLQREQQRPQCGLFIVDLRSGEIVHTLTFVAKNLREIFDVIALPGVRHPNALDLTNDDILDTITISPAVAL
ncbi:MAG: TIGR03032 family protein [Caldilineaceae bacterium]|nr:TIGR03032 family protein [Caldilineaceae bacterium]